MSHTLMSHIQMSHAPYYRQQAKLFTLMAAVCRDAERAAQFEAQARMCSNLAGVPDSSPALDTLLDEFNEHQMRKGLRSLRSAA